MTKIKCPYCKKRYVRIIPHLISHGCTEDEAERMVERLEEEGE